MTPPLRARLNEKFNRGAENHSFLVETVGGVETLKGMAAEPRWVQQWEKQLASYVSSGLAAATTGLAAATGVRLVSKLVTLAIVWARAVQPLGPRNITLANPLASMEESSRRRARPADPRSI